MQKRAFLCGINRYQIPGADLRGCVNDVENMRSVLTELFGFSTEHDPRVLIVWDGRAGDGPGGTSDFCLQLGVTAPDSDRVVVIDPTPRRYEHRQLPTPTPKRMLALDGGGIRGVVSLEVLKQIERQLREHLDDPKLRLVDYFDYIGGTGTGAILATALALGHHSASDLLELDEELGSAVFSKRWLIRRLRSLYRHGPLKGQLGAIIGHDRTLGDPDFESLLLLVLHNTKTDSVWPVTNNTAARHNRADRYLLEHPDRNLDLPLIDLVRGSTAAPIYFAPERIDVGNREMIFQDGGITPFNNPAFLMYILATSPAYGLGWSSGADDLLIVSVGTGASAAAHPELKAGKVNAFFNLVNLPSVFMNGASGGQDQICRTVGRCRYKAVIYQEFGNRIDDRHDAAFTYVRYEADLSDTALIDSGITSPKQRKRIRKLDAVDQLDQIDQIGRTAASNVDVSAHFAGFLNRPAD